jgi:hypothetical protein
MSGGSQLILWSRFRFCQLRGPGDEGYHDEDTPMRPDDAQGTPPPSPVNSPPALRSYEEFLQKEEKLRQEEEILRGELARSFSSASFLPPPGSRLQRIDSNATAERDDDRETVRIAVDRM